MTVDAATVVAATVDETVERASEEVASAVELDSADETTTTVEDATVVEATTDVGVVDSVLVAATVEGEAASEEETAAQISLVTWMVAGREVSLISMVGCTIRDRQR